MIFKWIAVLLVACGTLRAEDLIDGKTVGHASPVDYVRLVEGEVEVRFRVRCTAKLYPDLPYGPDKPRDFCSWTSQMPAPYPRAIEDGIELRDRGFRPEGVLRIPVGRDFVICRRDGSFELVYPKVQPAAADGYTTLYIIQNAGDVPRLWVRHFLTPEP